MVISSWCIMSCKLLYTYIYKLYTHNYGEVCMKPAIFGCLRKPLRRKKLQRQHSWTCLVLKLGWYISKEPRRNGGIFEVTKMDETDSSRNKHIEAHRKNTWTKTRCFFDSGIDSGLEHGVCNCEWVWYFATIRFDPLQERTSLIRFLVQREIARGEGKSGLSPKYLLALHASSLYVPWRKKRLSCNSLHCCEWTSRISHISVDSDDPVKLRLTSMLNVTASWFCWKQPWALFRVLVVHATEQSWEVN